MISFAQISILLLGFTESSLSFQTTSARLHKSFRPRQSQLSISLTDQGLKPVILAPAQFGVPEDYQDLRKELFENGFKLFVAPLSRLDWLKIVPATFTLDYIKGTLKPSNTLGFYYNALDNIIATVDAEYGPEVEVSFLGHSIGGWVLRAYIGEVLGAEAAARRVRALVTLGTPHLPPPAGSVWAAADQTRGLLGDVSRRFPAGWPLPSWRVTCVAGQGTRVAETLGGLVTTPAWEPEARRSPLLEQLVAGASYLALCGAAAGVTGDGVVPEDTACMPGVMQLRLAECHHAGFVPQPGSSLRLPGSYQWYGSPSQAAAWIPRLIPSPP